MFVKLVLAVVILLAIGMIVGATIALSDSLTATVWPQPY